MDHARLFMILDLDSLSDGALIEQPYVRQEDVVRADEDLRFRQVAKRPEQRADPRVAQRDVFCVPSRASLRAASSPQKPAPESVPSEVEREIVLRYKQQHYATWPDEPLPALKGKTPREAVRTRDGRKAVEELLRQFENGEERGSKAGRPAYDFSVLRKELGLSDS